MEHNKFIEAFGINYAGTIPKIKKSSDRFQPIYEALTNSFEAISLFKNRPDNGKINAILKSKSQLFSKESKDYDFDKIIIEDTGIGFTDQDFERFENLNDVGKGFLNKGSGRIQFIHFFDKTEYISVYQDDKSSTGFKEEYLRYLNQSLI